MHVSQSNGFPCRCADCERERHYDMGVCPECSGINGACVCFNDVEGCSRCHDEGGWHDCGEDSCCCGVNAELINEDWVWCPECHGDSPMTTAPPKQEQP